ncbi:hypothetical protein [Bifidobacterium sp.]|uniref:hypothetical protein n=1 Tax=Bifidobacterium sp. TaxID=41200 RepID=UPI00386C36F2
MDSLQVFQPSDGALSAESYQTFELAKENDTILGGTDIAQIRSYAAYARAQAQAIHKTIAATSGIEDVAAIKAEATETAQTFAKVGIYADQRIGEILRELPTRQGMRTDVTSVTTGTDVTKRQAEQSAGISHKQSIGLQAMAANPDVVQAVLDRAEAEGRIPSRKQVLDAIKDRDAARAVADKLKAERDDARAEIAALERQNDQLYEQASATKQPQVVERRVEVPSTTDKRRIKELEHLEQLHSSDNQKLRKKNEELRRELDKAKLLIGEKQRNDSAEWDIAALTTATNNYLRQYGGKAWAFDQFYRVDETTQAEFVKAINNLAAFAQNLAQMIREQSDE